MIRELAPAKVNLVLRVGPVAPNGLHEVCSLFASLELADVVEVTEAGRDSVVCDGVDGVNLAETAIEAFRAVHDLPPLEVRIEKRIPVAGGLAGGSADAAAVLRAAHRIAGEPFDRDVLLAIAAQLGSDVPSQVAPSHQVVGGTGEQLTPMPRGLPPMALVLVPSERGLSTADVFREADRLGIPRQLDGGECDALARAEWADAASVAAGLSNDLEAAALSLRPDIAGSLDALRRAGALGAQVTGSGPTAFGVFADRQGAESAASAIPDALVTMVATQ